MEIGDIVQVKPNVIKCLIDYSGTRHKICGMLSTPDLGNFYQLENCTYNYSTVLGLFKEEELELCSTTLEK